jgi:hypothetical protein
MVEARTIFIAVVIVILIMAAIWFYWSYWRGCGDKVFISSMNSIHRSIRPC